MNDFELSIPNLYSTALIIPPLFTINRSIERAFGRQECISVGSRMRTSHSLTYPVVADGGRVCQTPLDAHPSSPPGCTPPSPAWMQIPPPLNERSRNTVLVMCTQVHYLSHCTVQYGAHSRISSQHNCSSAPARADQPVE